MLLSGRFRFHPRAPRPESRALRAPESAPLVQLFAPPPEVPADHSALYPLVEGDLAYVTRLGLADLAEHCLDVQYYIWEDDRIGLVLFERLLAAAERGVRVRLLIDDIHTGGRDLRFARFDAHPNIEVRVFNPFGSRQWPGWRVLELLRDFSRLNHRMHNKAWIADSVCAVVGGRNIGENYFDLHPETNFRDLDLFVAGPAVAGISASFDMFWNSAWAIPIGSLVLRRYHPRHSHRLHRRLLKKIAAMPDFPYPVKLDVKALEARLEPHFVWAPVQVVYDPPDKLTHGQSHVWQALNQQLDAVRQSCQLDTAYFVPGTEGLAALQAMTERQVRVQVRTNSLASTDVIAAHAGYAKQRRQVLAQGVELYEMRPDSPVRRTRLLRLRARRSRAALHAKIGVFDERHVMVGSFNLDSRSIALNTEAVLLIDSPELARRISALFQEGLRPEHSWRVRLEQGKLTWTGTRQGQLTRCHSEPQTSWSRRLLAWFLTWLPVEHQV